MDYVQKIIMEFLEYRKILNMYSKNSNKAVLALKNRDMNFL